MVAGEAIHLAPVLLLELVAVDGVVEKEGEVRKQVKPIVEEIAMDMGRRICGAPPPLPGGTVAMGMAAVALIQGTEAPDEAAIARRGAVFDRWRSNPRCSPWWSG